MSDNKEIHQLYIELVKLQKEIIARGIQLLIILEGRDAAGKDGTIKAITKHLSPRETRVVALGKPSDREQNEWYFQRYMSQLPVNGEMVLFNRSWYNRAGVERVMGFCTEEEYDSFFKEVALQEEVLTRSGIRILKYYLDISRNEQQERLQDRREDPLKQWKISPIDKKALQYWNQYTIARDKMLLETNFSCAPWFVVDANHKKKARAAVISHILQQIRYRGKDNQLLSKEIKLIRPATPEVIERQLHR